MKNIIVTNNLNKNGSKGRVRKPKEAMLLWSREIIHQISRGENRRFFLHGRL